MGMRRLCGALRAVLAGLLSALSLGAAAEVAVTDQAGRRVVLSQPAQRIVLTDTSDFITLALIDDRPAQRLVAWNRWRLDADTLGALREADPLSTTSCSSASTTRTTSRSNASSR